MNDAPNAAPQSPTVTAAEPAYRLFALALLSLFLELAIIRFTAAHVLYLGYFSNFILVSAFLGVGVGFLLDERPYDLLKRLPETLLFLVGFVLLSKVDVTKLRESSGQIFFGTTTHTEAVPLWVALPVLFATVAFAFACVAQATARAFRGRAPLRAYSIDVAGSMAGIAAFTALSWLRASPTVAFAIVFALLGLLAPRGERARAIVVGAGTLLLLVATRSDLYVRWTPYQRLEVAKVDLPSVGGPAYYLQVNGVGHQTMQPVVPGGFRDFPYTELAAARGGKPIRRALVIGAGSGNDVAYALSRGVEHVDAVEIDPEILAAGRRFHPAHPYADPRVTVHIDDGRAFLERAPRGYDLVVFALPDSLASVSGLSNVRLETFLFTVESFKKAAAVLADDGMIVLYNDYRKLWLAERLADALGEVFGHPAVLHVVAKTEEGFLAVVAAGPKLGAPPRQGERLPLATDDWPFLYMERPHVPPLYVATMVLLVLAALGAVAATGRLDATSIRTNGPFALMGAAFLLLETKSVVQFALLFGATWLVNALVFFAILASVLLANLVTQRLPNASPAVPFLLLVVALAAGVVVEPGSLLAISSPVARYVVASTLWFAPIFFANVAFAQLFRGAAHTTTAFGMNVVGTTIGGAFEYLSLGIGYQALGIVVAALYVAAAVWALAVARADRDDPAAERAAA